MHDNMQSALGKLAEDLWEEYLVLVTQALAIAEQIREDETRRAQLYPTLQELDARRDDLLEQIDRVNKGIFDAVTAEVNTFILTDTVH